MAHREPRTEAGSSRCLDVPVAGEVEQKRGFAMSWFVDDASITSTIVAACRSRALGAGVDGYEYDQLTSSLHSLSDWLGAFSEAARLHASIADAAENEGHLVTALNEWRLAAACGHIANTLPHPDASAAVRSDKDAAIALRRPLELRRNLGLDGHVIQIIGDDSTARIVGELRMPVRGSASSPRPPVAVLVPGLDSGRAEFLDLADALIARRVAVVAFDGPGQGELADTPPQAQYHPVCSAVLDHLAHTGEVDMRRVALIGLSLGGLYTTQAAAVDGRIAVVATISGAYPLPAWQDMPPFVVDTLIIRCGSRTAARTVHPRHRHHPPGSPRAGEATDAGRHRQRRRPSHPRPSP